MMETDGRGVDLVLNSLAEEKLLASVRCLAKGGRFLEIGKFDLANNNPLGEQSHKVKPSYKRTKPVWQLISFTKLLIST